MECFDIHVALEACDIVIESATVVATLKSDSKTAKHIISQSGFRVTGQTLKTKVVPLRGAAKQRMSCRGLACRPAAHFVLVRFYGLGRCVQVERRFHSIHRGIHLSLLKQLWLAVDEVVHHDDVMLAIIIRPRGNVAGRDPDRRDARVVKHDAEEGQASIARRGRDETAEYQLTILDRSTRSACWPWVAMLSRSAAIWLVNICEHRAEALTVAGDSRHWYRV